MERDSVAVIILNWNGASDTISCLESLLKLDAPNFAIFVCDNASADSSINLIRGWSEKGLRAANEARLASQRTAFGFRDLSESPSDGKDYVSQRLSVGNVTLIQTGWNGGYAAGNNVGLRYALAEGFEYFWILNNDTEVESDSISWLLHRMKADSSIGMCGSTVIYAGQRDLVQNWGGASFIPLKGRGVQLGARRNPSEPIDEQAVERELGYICGAAIFVSRAFLESIGLMQEDYFLYWEEMDWAARAKGLFRLGYASKSIVYHKVGASIGTNDFGDRSPLSDFYMARSRVKFCARFSRISLPFVFGEILRSALKWMIRGKWRRAYSLIRAALGLTFLDVK